jgi:hypothetical protein
MTMRARDTIKDILDELIMIVALQLFPSTITEERSVLIFWCASPPDQLLLQHCLVCCLCIFAFVLVYPVI